MVSTSAIWFILFLCCEGCLFTAMSSSDNISLNNQHIVKDRLLGLYWYGTIKPLLCLVWIYIAFYVAVNRQLHMLQTLFANAVFDSGLCMAYRQYWLLLCERRNSWYFTTTYKSEYCHHRTVWLQAVCAIVCFGQYLGTWYEIYRFPDSHVERNETCVNATYCVSRYPHPEYRVHSQPSQIARWMIQKPTTYQVFNQAYLWGFRHCVLSNLLCKVVVIVCIILLLIICVLCMSTYVLTFKKPCQQ